MKRNFYVLIIGSMAVSGCGTSGDQGSKNEAAANAAQPEPKPTYCFFKSDEMKGWKASRDGNGDLTVEGEAHVKDPRYMASFGKTEVGAKKAVLQPTITQNDLGYAMPDNWWHLRMIVPNSSSVNEATVECGDKIVADLQVPPKA